MLLMNHWVILPLVLPLLSGTLLLLGSHYGLTFKRTLNLLATGTLLLLSGYLLISTLDGHYQVYRVGDWPTPFAIVLVIDRLSALMLLLTSILALFSLCHALDGTDAQGSYFHALFQFQLLGLNGAFVTGDLFNLFVFFEILLLASYGLLLHGGGKARVRAGFHYVVLNLTGSALFLFGIGILYGVTGTLNMADLALKIAHMPDEHAFLIQAGALLLLLVFALKAALFPLYFWLPGAYSNTSAPVAALFAVMTKVGVYAIVRLFTLAFGPAAGAAANAAMPWLLPLALVTLAAGSLGVLASHELRRMLAYFVVVSIGTLLIAVGLFTVQGLTAALVYLIHTTLVTGGMFLLADLIIRERGHGNEQTTPPVTRPFLLGGLFAIGALTLAGLPPFSGFLGKLLLLKATQEASAVIWIWSLVLITGLLGIVALCRIASALFWRTQAVTPVADKTFALSVSLPTIGLLAGSPLLIAFAEPITGFADATARQLTQPERYMEQVLGQEYIDAFRRESGALP